MNAPSTPTPPRAEEILRGRAFFHGPAELLLVAGGLSIVVALAIAGRGVPLELTSGPSMALVLLLANSAHFAASTVRLYDKPGARTALPFLTRVFPLVSLAVVTLCVAMPVTLGRHLQALYLTWSPYHYAAQAYGIAVVYAYRSGCRLTLAHKRWLYLAALPPFLSAFFGARWSGLRWLVPQETLMSTPWVAEALTAAGAVLPVLGLAAPFVVFALLLKSKSGPLPVISLVSLLANASWFFVMVPMQAFVLATVAHSVQYLALVLIFHVRELGPLPARAAWRAAAGFYGRCVLLALALWHVLPLAFEAVGYGPVEAMLMVTAAINLHHFIVDGFIWKMRPGDSNRHVVAAVPAGASAAPVGA